MTTAAWSGGLGILLLVGCHPGTKYGVGTRCGEQSHCRSPLICVQGLCEAPDGSADSTDTRSDGDAADSKADGNDARSAGDASDGPESAADAASGDAATSGVRGYTRPNGQHAIIYRGDGLAGLIEQSGTPPGSPVSWGGNVMLGSSPWGYTRSDGVEAVLYIDPSRHVHELTPSGSGFNDADFTSQFAAPTVAADSPMPDLIAYRRSDGISAIVYKADNKHVFELSSNFGHQPEWVVSDVSTVAMVNNVTVTVGRGSPCPYVRSDGLNTIVYVGSDDRLHELTSNFSGFPTWRDGDLGVVSGDTTTVPASSPWAYVRSDGFNAVVFIDTGGNLRELSFKPGQYCDASHTWCSRLLPAVMPTSSFRPTGYVRADSVNAVVYVSNASSIRELAFIDGNWVPADLPMPTDYIPASDPFGHRPPVDRASVVVQGKNTITGDLKAIQIALPFNGDWTASVL